MADNREFGPVLNISAEAIGQPGQRRFRLRAYAESGATAFLWLEKEQLVALSEAIETVLKDEGYRYQRLPLDDSNPDPVYPLDPEVEFRARQLSMGVNRDSQRVVLVALEGVEPDEQASALSLEFDYRRAFELRREIEGVVSAGRPACPLCNAPMDPAGHVCVRSNGHHPH